jgi:hypothetical protein
MNTSALMHEHEMTTKARGLLALQVGQDPAVGRARALAQTVKGMVVTTEAEAAGAADTARGISEGMKAVDAYRLKVLEIPAEVTRAVNAYAKTLMDELKAARKSCDDATAGYLMRKAEEAERELEQQRAQAVVEAAQDAAETGEVAVPLEAPDTVKPQTMVRGAAGTQGLVEVLKCAWDVPPHAWATLDEAAAKAWFRVEVKAGRLPRPKLGGKARVLGNGVLFWVEASIASRGA